MPEWHDIVFRFGAATLIGALMGVYLELRGKPTGLRMLGLVALASAVAVLAVAQHSEADIAGSFRVSLPASAFSVRG
jgi:putative Mg2+ transporter-C (MgtC) family protein